MKKQRYVLQCVRTGTFNGADGKPTKDLNKAALFTARELLRYADIMAPNFQFLSVEIKSEVRTLTA